MRTFALALAMVLAFAAAAEARTWRGETEQGRGVSVRTGDDGEVELVRVNWKARCEKGSYRSRTVFERPFDISERTLFEDAGTVRVNAGDSYRTRHRVYVRGRLEGDRWTGTFRVRTRVTKDGRFVDRCRLRGVSWTAEPVR
jgi:hypothetical protein